MVKNPLGNAGDGDSMPGWGRYPWRRKWQPFRVFLRGKSHGQRSLEGSSPWGCKGSDTTERLHFDLLSLFHIVYGCILGVLFSYPSETFHIDEFMMLPSAAAVREKCLFTLRR